jgi:hypothetical protein
MNMKYFVIKVIGSNEDAVVDALPEGSPAEWKFHEGVSLAAEFPADAKLKFSDNFPDARRLAEFMPNILSLLIASPAVQDALRSCSMQGIELLPVSIIDHRENEVGTDYAIINPLDSQPIIDMDKSELRMSNLEKDQVAEIDNLVIDSDRVDDGVALFRATAHRRLFFARQDFVEQLQNRNIVDVRAYPADGWDGLDF